MKCIVLKNLFITIVFITICLSAQVGFSAGKVVELRFAQFHPAVDPAAIIISEWCKEVMKRTEGRVKVTHYPGGTLSGPVQTYDNVIKGVIDIGDPPIGYNAGKFPLSEVFDYPLGSPSTAVSTKLVNAYYAKFKPKEFDQVKILYFHSTPPCYLYTKTKPVRNLADLKGMKIRTIGQTAKMIQYLGGVPVGMSIGEIYDSLSRGVVDGILSADLALKTWKTGEVIKYATRNRSTAYSTVFVVAMNTNKWASIEPRDQKVIEQINEEWIKKQAKVWEAQDIDGQKYIKERGIEIIELSQEENALWAAKATPLFDAYVKATKEKGLPGDEVLNFAREFIKQNSK
ncbi:MAG: TRAP transporter substrate-binding protein [Deltaproteobacteria bacterium]|nr:TRAP transporter substrate-binding protein [Deltaproteobacteria bacterium]